MLVRVDDTNYWGWSEYDAISIHYEKVCWEVHASSSPDWARYHRALCLLDSR